MNIWFILRRRYHSDLMRATDKYKDEVWVTRLSLNQSNALLFLPDVHMWGGTW